MVEQFLLLSGITLLAYYIKGMTGFGNTLVMNSLFSFLKENRFTTPVDLLLSLPANGYLAWKNRRQIAWRIVLPLSLAVVIGNLPGIFLLRAGSDHVLKVILGGVLIFLSIQMFANPADHQENGRSKINPSLNIWFVGLISGVLMGLFGIGALLATYIARRANSRNDYRANLCFVFIIDNLFRLAAYWNQGILTGQVWLFFLLLSPAAAAGMWLSVKTDNRISEDIIKKLVLILLAVSGLILIVNNIIRV